MVETITEIRPNRNWLAIPVREIVAYRDLLYLLIHRDFVSKYKQTVLGPLWFFIQPLASALIFNFVFNTVSKVPTDGLPGPLFYMSGLLAWSIVQATFNGNAGVFRANQALFGKVYFPRLIVPLAQSGTALISTFVQLVSFLSVFCYFIVVSENPEFIPGWNALLLVPAIIFGMLLGLGAGLCFSALTAKYRDFLQALAFISQGWMLLSAVVFPVSSIPDSVEGFLVLNPAVGIVSLTRAALLNAPLPEPAYLISACVGSLAIFLVGVLCFNRVERTFIDSV